MPRRSGSSRRGGGRKHKVYSLRQGSKPPSYFGTTQNPSRRAAQHRRDGKRGEMHVEAEFDSHRAARRSEASRLFHHRRKHGQNPEYNKTDSGGWEPKSFWKRLLDL